MEADENCLHMIRTRTIPYNLEYFVQDNRPRNSPYRRVRAEEVLVDPRLADNSYDAKKNNQGSNFGAKANQVLRQVKGRDFR